MKIEMTPEEYRNSIGYGEMLEGQIDSLFERMMIEDVGEYGTCNVVKEVVLNKYTLLEMIKDRNDNIDFLDDNVKIRIKE